MKNLDKNGNYQRALRLTLITVFIFSILSLTGCGGGAPAEEAVEYMPEAIESLQPAPVSASSASSSSSASSTPPVPPASPMQTPRPKPKPEPLPWELFSPHFVEETDPFGPRINYEYAVQVDGAIAGGYTNPDQIFFGLPETYTKMPGITTFRGNNFRNGASYGTADITEETLTEVYRFNIGSLGSWSGVGWTGQPCIVKWDNDVRQQMNLLPDKKEKADLVEVIQGALDGYVYFYDLEDGQRTRQPLRVGEVIKGGVTTDPRGYPLLYIGQGDTTSGSGRMGYYIYSLIDGSRLYYLRGFDNFALRYWGAFDGNPLFDIPNDRLFLNGENGLIYNIKLNTDYDREAGTISVNPEIIRYRYSSTMNKNRQFGIESSLSIFLHYAFTADNGGVVQCVDLMTFEPVWVRDCTDDTDSTIVLEWEEENNMLALYTGSESDYQGLAYIRKLNAENGELLWEYTYPCLTNRDISGGVLSTPVTGRGDISDLVIFWVGKVRGMTGGAGVLVAFDKATGEVVWENVLPNYGWSSPVGIYTEDGNGYIVVCDSGGRMFLVRGTTGELLHTANLRYNIEASPAVYGNMIVVGSRGSEIIGIKVS